MLPPDQVTELGKALDAVEIFQITCCAAMEQRREREASSGPWMLVSGLLQIQLHKGTKETRDNQPRWNHLLGVATFSEARLSAAAGCLQLRHNRAESETYKELGHKMATKHQEFAAYAAFHYVI